MKKKIIWALITIAMIFIVTSKSFIYAAADTDKVFNRIKSHGALTVSGVYPVEIYSADMEYLAGEIDDLRTDLYGN